MIFFKKGSNLCNTKPHFGPFFGPLDRFQKWFLPNYVLHKLGGKIEKQAKNMLNSTLFDRICVFLEPSEFMQYEIGQLDHFFFITFRKKIIKYIKVMKKVLDFAQLCVA